MNTSFNDADSRNVLDTQQQQQPIHQRKDKSSTGGNRDKYETKEKHKKRHEKKKTAAAAAYTFTPTDDQQTKQFTGNNSTKNQTTLTNTISNISSATQFSIQRSDSDGCLKMKISAIRPTAAIIQRPATPNKTNLNINSTNTTHNALNNANKTTTTTLHKLQTKEQNAVANSTQLNTTSKIKRNSLQPKLDATKDIQVMPSSCFIPTSLLSLGGGAPNDKHEKLKSSSCNTTLTLLKQQQQRLSDATDSGCSEATTNTTTIPTTSPLIVEKSEIVGANISPAKRKVKRKKSALENSKKSAAAKSRRQQPIITAVASEKHQDFSTDSEDEPLSAHKLHNSRTHADETQLQSLAINSSSSQRAPRLLITSIGCCAKSNASPTNVSATLPLSSSAAVDSLVCGLSSSDNELPNVKAAIERVMDGCGDDDDDDDDVALANNSAAVTQYQTFKQSNPLPQYQSTLLQDFMERTQMLGQKTPTKKETTTTTMMVSTTAALAASPADCSKSIKCDLAYLTPTTNSQTDSVASSPTTMAKARRRRGRPTKRADKLQLDLNLNSLSSPPTIAVQQQQQQQQQQLINNLKSSSNINESTDSGIISTTSAQSTSSLQQQTRPTTAAETTAPLTASTNSTPEKSSNEAQSATAEQQQQHSKTKPKIDIALLDKRMYATERVLYPPPRNKRRQSCSAAIQEKKANAATVAKSLSKDELDPVWRKIDINRKFRRPSVCSTTGGYKTDGDCAADDAKSATTPLKSSTVCSKILAAKSGYVSDYGGCSSAAAFSRRHSRHQHTSGYKSDASCKSRYSTKSCASRKSRAKSCGYRSDYKDCAGGMLGSGGGGGVGSSSAAKSSKFRRKRRASIVSMHQARSMGSLKDEQDILQLAGLSLGQSSEESNEYICKPSLEKLPTTSASKKYGEINRYITTGKYFGADGDTQTPPPSSFAALSLKSATSANSKLFDLQAVNLSASTAAATSTNKTAKNALLHQRKMSSTSEFAHELLQLPDAGVGSGSNSARKIKSRRSSVASYCSSYYSQCTSKLRKRRRRKSFRFHNNPSSSAAKHHASVVDSKLLTEIEILIQTFSAKCKIQNFGLASADKPTAVTAATSQKEKLMAEATKLQQSLAAQQASCSAYATTAASSSFSKKDGRDTKRSLKKRKIPENLDFAMLSARAGLEANGLATSTALCQTAAGSNKRRHKKSTSSSSPDDHKLPLKKRHYLLTPGDKGAAEVAAVAVAAKLFANSEAWAVAAAAAKTTANTKSQQQFHAKNAKANLSPKKRHLLQQPAAAPAATPPPPPILSHLMSEDSNTNSQKTPSSCTNDMSPLRVTVGDPNSISGGKLLDISPQSLNSLKQATEAVHKKRNRLEGLVSKMSTIHTHSCLTTEELQLQGGGSNSNSSNQQKTRSSSALHLESESSSCPPPGVFEPSVELEIQIPAIAKLSEASASGIIAKAELESPLLLDLSKGYMESANKLNGPTRLVEDLLNKTAGNLLLKRKRKKINRTGFPTVRRKKRKLHENLSAAELEGTATAPIEQDDNAEAAISSPPPPQCDRVPQQGETSQTFLERNTPRTPRLSVVALERLQESPQTSKEAKEKDKKAPLAVDKIPTPNSTPRGRQIRQLVKKPIKAKLLNKKTSVTTVVAPPAIPDDEDDDKPLASRQRRSKQNHRLVSTNVVRSVAATPAIPPALDPVHATAQTVICTTPATPSLKNSNKKSTTPNKIQKSHKLLPKTLIDPKIKLPKGIDPNTLLSCKIKLKRKKSIALNLIANGSQSKIIVAPKPRPPAKVEVARTAEEIENDAKAKDCNLNELEHDVLPIEENPLLHWKLQNQTSAEQDERDCDDKASTPQASAKKSKLTKKNYLPAGLYSDYFKREHINLRRTLSKKEQQQQDKTSAERAISSPSEEKELDAILPIVRASLPPPPYCERYLRRSIYDFELPYDIWWAYTNSKLPSRITVASWNFRKIRTNIYADNVKPSPIGANDHPTCNCKPDKGCNDNCLNRMVYTECSPSNCPARDKCHNQKIQRHEIAPGVERFMTENKGWGVRTKLDIPKGTYILEYVGEVVTEREFKDRMGSIYLNDTHHYCLHLDGGLVIDGHRMGSDCRFVNHSCEPNCEMQKWSVNGLSRMVLFAKRLIEAGEELTYDYNFSLFNPSEGQPCRCNTPNCRGVIGGKSQRVKPLPIETKLPNEVTAKEDRRKGRQRKHKARKNTQRQASKDVATPTKMHALSEKEKRLIKQNAVFLIRNYEKIRRIKAAKRKQAKGNNAQSAETKLQSPTNANAATNSQVAGELGRSGGAGVISTAAKIMQRRPSTPATLAAQISALCMARNIKTRGLTLAVQDPEIERMAKMAKILRDICANIELIKNPNNEQQLLISALTSTNNSNSKKKKASLKAQQQIQKHGPLDLKTIQSNIEQGFYKLPAEFNADFEKLFSAIKETIKETDSHRQSLFELLQKSFQMEKQKHFAVLLELIQDAELLKDFKAANDQDTIDMETGSNLSLVCSLPIPPNYVPPAPLVNINSSTQHEDMIRCICGLFRDEGLMIQCARCMVWQHTECTKADINADKYLCEICQPRNVNREIPLEDFTEEGYRYYLTLMRGKELQVRQGDAVYVLRDIPIKDPAAATLTAGGCAAKHTYETIGDIDYNECDIFRVERLWKSNEGKRFIFGHHFLRPHETFHEPTRKFYPNEVVRVPLYEVVPIELVIGRCWVLDRTTFCKGRPIECTEEAHCYICELRVDKSARFFSRAKTNHPTCTKTYAFRKFEEKLRISKTYAPHEIDPSLLKPKKQKIDNDLATDEGAETTSSNEQHSANTDRKTTEICNKNLQNTTTTSSSPSNSNKKRQINNSPAIGQSSIAQSSVSDAVKLQQPLKTFKAKRNHLEIILKSIKQTRKSTNNLHNAEPPLDVSYLLTGRGARQRKTLPAIITSLTNSNNTNSNN